MTIVAPEARPLKSVRSGSVGIGAKLKTPGFARVQTLCTSTLNHRALCVIHGPAGIGKTVATRHFLEGVEGWRTVWLDVRVGTTNRSFDRELYGALTGTPTDEETYSIEGYLRELLSAPQPIAIVIDEVQRFGLSQFELLRSLHDDDKSNFAVIFVGGPSAWRVIAQYPMLRSRIFHEVDFPLLTPDEIVTLLPNFHGIYRGADEVLLQMISESVGQRFRKIAQFTVIACDVMDSSRRGTLSYPVVQAALERMGGTPEAYDD